MVRKGESDKRQLPVGEDRDVPLWTMGKRELLANALESTGLGGLLSATLLRWQGLLVFNYHRVGDPAESPFDHALWSASQEEFDRQVRFLKRHFDLVTLGDLPDVLHRPGQRAVLITFDDGYLDNFELAYPVLRQHDATALFFITSGFLDERFVAWWDEIAWMVRTATIDELPSFDSGEPPHSLVTSSDRDAAIKQVLRKYKTLDSSETELFLDRLAETVGSGRCPHSLAESTWMTWDMVREMDRSGMEFGGHTVAHPVLAKHPVDVQRQEIVGCKERLETELGHPITAFSYPVGQRDSYTDETKSLLREAGYLWAFSFFGGFSQSGPLDPYSLPRVAVSPQISPVLFRSTARLPRIFA